MSWGYSGSWWSEGTREAANRREQRAEIAALAQEAAVLRDQAAALRRIIGGAAVTFDIGTRAKNATWAEVSRHADVLRAVIADARLDLERQISEAFARRLRERLGKTGRREDQSLAVTRPAGAVLPDSVVSGVEVDVSAQAGQERIAQAISTARQILADNLSRCDPADAERLEWLALGLGESGLAGVATLRHAITESVDRRQRARQAAISRERLRVLIADAMPEERGALLELLRDMPDRDLPSLANQSQAAVARADRRRARVQVAHAAVGALTELGCAVGTGFAVVLTQTDTVIVPMQDFPGYGLRISLSSGSLKTLVVKQAGVIGDCDVAVQQAVSDRMDLAWARLSQAGIVLTERHRTPAGTEPVPAIDERQWDHESRGIGVGSDPDAIVGNDRADGTARRLPTGRDE